MRVRDLEKALEAVPGFPVPDAAREQYRTPARIAAEWMAEAHRDGDIEGKRVLDLGCGTGVLAKAAVLLGAREVLGVDQDAAAVAVAQEAVPEAHFEVAELADWAPPAPVDTVVMNPPFGAQHKHADRVFYEKAMAATKGAIWFLQQPVNERFLVAFFAGRGRSVERVRTWDYPLEARFAFHAKGVQTMPVGLYVA